MNGAIIAALISGAASILVTIITVISTNSKTRQEIRTQLALQEERQKTITDKVDELSAEVRAHNEYGRQIPVLQEKLANLDHRIGELERRGA